MGRSAYWIPAAGRLPSWALGDASRGALYLALRLRGEQWGEPVATTPRAAGSLRFFSESAGAFGAAQPAQGPEREEQHEAERRPVGEGDLRRLAGDEAARRL